MPILPEELAAVDRALRRHPRASNYRLSASAGQIEVYERTAIDMMAMLAAFGHTDPTTAPTTPGGFRLVLRFVLADPDLRRYRVERWAPDSEAWTILPTTGTLTDLVHEMPTLLSSA